ncbi:hypothetical protein BVRB_9g208960 [Beta vulgaris subsp. vulgaris]|uniref:Uncharacterized protein n=1 Tax=Beta vulgaris subsp. vulgaris TaxID=3555 RepID=A0A0J8BPR0_BETVV|nr:hypothetical protein BVRB_9g208960 [Beta vulgaris subsp. vulgaris]
MGLTRCTNYISLPIPLVRQRSLAHPLLDTPSSSSHNSCSSSTLFTILSLLPCDAHPAIADTFAIPL